MEIFEWLSTDVVNPLFIWRLNEDKKRKWTLYDLSDMIRSSGWQVPAYTLPERMSEVIVMRIVVRQGTGIDLADLLIKDIKHALAKLNALEYPTNSLLEHQSKIKKPSTGFTHSR